MEKDIKIEIGELFLLRNLFDGNRYLKLEDIETYFKKKRHSSGTKDYRPGSEQWLKEKQKDDEIAELPDIDISDTYADLTIKVHFTEREIRFDIMTYKTSIQRYDEDADEYEIIPITSKFLTGNSHWGGDFITSIEGLFSHYSIISALMTNQRHQLEEKWRKELEEFVPSFWILLPEVMEALDTMGTVDCYTKYDNIEGNCIVIKQGTVENVYTQTFIDKVEKAYKNGVKLYDERDRAISPYGARAYMEAYRQYPPTEEVANG